MTEDIKVIEDTIEDKEEYIINHILVVVVYNGLLQSSQSLP